MSELYLFMDIALPIIIILIVSILIAAIISRTLGGWLAAMGLVIGFICWIGYLDHIFLIISGLFIAISMWLGIKESASGE